MPSNFEITELSERTFNNFLKFIIFIALYPIYIYIYIGDRGGTVVKVLCYRSEGRRFDFRWGHWDFLLT